MEVDEPSVGRTKAACLELERGKVGLEVDVEPLATGGPRVKCSSSDDLGSDSPASPEAARTFVDSVFRHLLGRPADPEAISYYSARRLNGDP